MSEKELTNDKKGFYAGMLFLIWPIFSLMTALKNYRDPWAKNVLWAFTAFYGFCFAIGAENSSADIVRYVAHYQSLYPVDLSISSFFNYFQESGELDILKNLIALLLSRITDSQVALTTVYGTIFGYFLSRNIWYLLDRLEGQIKSLTILLLICFFLVNPIWNMNGFRMWTAAHIFIYGLLPFLFEGRKDRLLLCFASIFVHFSFVLPVGTLCMYLVLGNRLYIYFAFFLTTFFISEIDLEVFNRLVENYAPEVIQEQTAGYRNEQYVQNFREGPPESQNWYVVWYGRALRWSVMGFLVLLFIKGRDFFTQNRRWLNLFCFTLLFYGIANLLSSLPSAGRFITVANMSALSLIIFHIQNREQAKVVGRFVWAATPALMLYIIVAIRIALYSMSATAILGNPVIGAILMGEHISMNDVMRMII